MSEKNDPCQWSSFANLSSSLETVDARQSNVKKDDVWQQSLCLLDGFWSIVRCTDNLKVGMEIENGANMATKGVVVFHHENTNPGICRGWSQ